MEEIKIDKSKVNFVEAKKELVELLTKKQIPDFNEFIKEAFDKNNFEFYKKHKDKVLDCVDKVYEENQALKDRWQKLKEWVERKYADNYIDANDTKSPLTAQEYYGGSADSCRKTLDKMQELEKEIN